MAFKKQCDITLMFLYQNLNIHKNVKVLGIILRIFAAYK